MPDMLISLIAFAAAATFSPGGATTLATASGARFGLARSVPVILGVGAGLATLMGVVGGGLGAIVHTLPAVELVFKVAGSAYLIWLAIAIGRLGSPNAAAQSRRQPWSFAKAFILMWLNPKGWTMAVAAASTFTMLDAGPARAEVLLAAVFGASATMSMTLWCVIGQWLARQMKTEAHWRAMNVSFGLLLAASIIPIWL